MISQLLPFSVCFKHCARASMSPFVGWSAGGRFVKNCQKEVSGLIRTVQVFSKITIAFLSVQLHSTTTKQALLSLEAAIKREKVNKFQAII